VASIIGVEIGAALANAHGQVALLGGPPGHAGLGPPFGHAPSASNGKLAATVDTKWIPEPQYAHPLQTSLKRDGPSTPSTFRISKWEKTSRASSARKPELIGLTLAPDGRTLASVGKDGTVILWEIATGKERCLSARLALRPLLARRPGPRLRQQGRARPPLGRQERKRTAPPRRAQGGGADTGLLRRRQAALLGQRRHHRPGLGTPPACPPSPADGRPAAKERTGIAVGRPALRGRGAGVPGNQRPGRAAHPGDGPVEGRARPTVLDRGGCGSCSTTSTAALRHAPPGDDRVRKPGPRRGAGPAETVCRRRFAGGQAPRRGILHALESAVLPAEVVRSVRMVEMLERVGTPEARHLLQTLAGSTPGTPLTEEAKAALDGRAGPARALRPVAHHATRPFPLLGAPVSAAGLRPAQRGGYLPGPHPRLDQLHQHFRVLRTGPAPTARPR